MTNAASDKLDAMMKKVEAMLALADDPRTPEEEADNARQFAERIMVKYKIEQEDLLARGELSINAMNVLFKEVRVYNRGSEFSGVYRFIAAAAISHTGCYGVWSGMAGDEYVITIAGYEADIRYAEALLMGARLLFAGRMEPKPDPSLSDAENVYRMRSAGMERIRVANLMGWAKGGAKVTRMYKAECERRGEDPTLVGRGMSVKDFRLAYADGFQTEFWNRLTNARLAIEKEVGEGGLVLHGRKERIMEQVYIRWPQLRPSTEPAKVERQVKVKPYRWTAADQKRLERQNSPAGLAGRNAGKKAAQEVNINTGTPTKRLTD